MGKTKLRVVWAIRARGVVIAIKQGMHAHRLYMRLAGEPIKVAAVCIAAMCSYIFGELRVCG